MNDFSSLPVVDGAAVTISKEEAAIMRFVVDKLLAVFECQALYEFARGALRHDPVSTRILDICLASRTPRANMASFDFHVVDGKVQLIEWSLFPAGLSFAAGEIFDDEYGLRYTEAFLRLFDAHDSIAVIDTDLSRQLFLPEFFWLQDVLEERGKTVFVCEASDIAWNDASEQIVARGLLRRRDGELIYERLLEPVAVDFVANRLPFDDFRDAADQFSGLMEAQCNAPDRFLTDYFEWLISEKSSLVFLRDLPELAPYLGDACFSTEFSSVAEVRKRFGQKIASKPLFSKGGRGVLIKPSNPQLQAILDDANPFVFQRYVAAPKLENGNKYDLRVLWVAGGEPLFVARQFQGAVTNFRAANTGHSAVEVV